MPAPSAVVRPALGWFVVLDGGLVVLAVLATSRRCHEAVASTAPLPPRRRLKTLLVAALAVHVGEAMAAARLARRHDLPAAAWAAQTAVVGFPSLLALRRTVASR